MATGRTRNVSGIIPAKSSVPGKIPTGTTGNEIGLLKFGEIASNLADKRLWGYDGSNVFEYGQDSYLNLTGGTVSGNTNFTANLSASTIFSGSTDLDTIIRNISDGNDTFITGSSLSLNSSLVLSRNDGADVTQDLSITRQVNRNAEAFALNTATRVVLTPITISAVRFAGTGLPDIAGVGFVVPDDYKDGGQFSYIWRTSSTSTGLDSKIVFDVYTGDTGNTGSLVTSAESFEIIDSPESTANVFIFSPNSTLSATTLSSGMKIHLTVERDPGDAADTLGSDVDMTDLVFKYNALR